MNPEKNRYLYAVVLDGVWYVDKFEIAKESEKIYFLANGSAVHKDMMRDFQTSVEMWYYVDEKEAERVLRIKECSFLLNKYANGCDYETRFDAIKLANADEIANLFIDMIHELCEDGVPSSETVRDWLLTNKDKNIRVDEETKETSEDNELVQEDYSKLKDGDTIYYVDFDDNKVVRGIALGVRRKYSDNSVKHFAFEAPNDFMGCSGELLGEKVFINKELAERKLREDNKNV